MFDGVVPRAGTWIETQSLTLLPNVYGVSFPVRERGLKQHEVDGNIIVKRRRSPCGNVD